MDGKQILDLPMQTGNDAKAATVRDYLKALLSKVWEKDEDFSGKRPFGNSGWQTDLAEPLVTAKLITGEFDCNGFLDDYDDKAAHAAIMAAIAAL